VNKKDKALGMLLGLHVGDLFGFNLEFKEKYDIYGIYTKAINSGILGFLENKYL